MLDAEQFLNSGIEGASETTFTPVPADDDGYICTIPENGLVGPREFDNKNGGKSVVLDINWEIVDDEKKANVVEVTGMANPRVKQSIFLDVIRGSDDQVTGLAMGKGKNIGLGRLREALGQNDGKKKWSFKHLVGAMARVAVSHRSGQNGEEYAEVKRDGVTAL